VVACKGCGHPLPADASFCANCGRAAESSDETRPEAEAEPEPEAEAQKQPVDDTIFQSLDPWER
jgi:predicted amidophosphoribosyltransferase